MDNDKVILELRDVSKIYESVNALSNINLKVKKGDWIAIMGSSGSGKTTMMAIIAERRKEIGLKKALGAHNIRSR